MSNIDNLANNILVMPPKILESKPDAARQNADIGQSDPFPTENRRPLDPKQPANRTPRPDDDTTSNEKVTGNSDGNFRQVLERRLSQKSDKKQESEEKINITDSDEISSTQKPLMVKKPVNNRIEHTKKNCAHTEMDQLKLQKTTGESAMPSHHVIIAIPVKLVSGEKGKTMGTATGRKILLSRVPPETHNPAKGKVLQAEQLKSGDNAAKIPDKEKTVPTQTIKNDKTGALAETSVRDDGAKDNGTEIKKTIAKTDNSKTNNVPLSNKKGGAEQNQARIQINDSTPKKPALDIDTKFTKDQSVDILNENSGREALPATAKIAIPDEKNAAIDYKQHNGTPQGGANTVTNAKAKPQTFAPSKDAKLAAQKDNTDAQAAFDAAQTKVVVADKDGSEPFAVEATTLGPKATDVSSVINTRWHNSGNTTTSQAGGGIRNNGNIQPSPAQQVIDSIRLNIGSNQQQIYLSLNPPELGRVAMLFRNIDGGITGILKVENLETKYDIEKELPQIVASLQQSGIQVGRVNVVINDQNPQALLKNNDMHNDDFAGMPKHEFTSQSSDDKSDRPNSPKPDNPGPVTQQPTNMKNEITDNTINIYV